MGCSGSKGGAAAAAAADKEDRAAGKRAAAKRKNIQAVAEAKTSLEDLFRLMDSNRDNAVSTVRATPTPPPLSLVRML